MDEMKALTVWQPWASLLAFGAKGFETRSWMTNYRGPIAIHAAAKDSHSIMLSLPTDTQKVIYNCLNEHFGIKSGVLNRMPRGSIIATAELVGCHQIVKIGWNGTTERRIAWVDGSLNPHYPTEREILLGDWTPDRYAWEITNVKVLDVPIPAKGKQGLWNWKEAS